MSEARPPRNYIAATLGCYCPRCREGKLFIYATTIRVKRNMAMHPNCILCTQPTELEVGFYYGTSYVSYVIGVVFSLVSFLLWWLLIGLSFNDNRFMYWVGLNSISLIVIQPWLMRFSRSLWISWFVTYDPDWQTHPPEKVERMNLTEKNNW